MSQDKLGKKILSELFADIIEEYSAIPHPVVFKGEMLDGKGLIWSGQGNNKQFLFSSNPDKFFSSESIELAKGKNIIINNLPVINESSLGASVTKSNLKEVGRLKNLVIDGSLAVGGYLNYDSNTNRLGIGTENPKTIIDLVEDNIEILIGCRESSIGFIGTFNSQDFEIHTDNTARIKVGSDGDITLGNPAFGPVHVNVLGKLSVNVNSPDHRAALHVNGSIKFNNKIHVIGICAPEGGSYSIGDICWNSEPRPGGHVGWICIQSGNPGIWNPFGRID